MLVSWRVIPGASAALVFYALVSGAIVVLGPVITNDTIGSDGWGIAQSCQTLGTFAAGLVLTKVTLRVPLRTIMIASALWCLPMLALGTYVKLWLLCAASVIAGAALGLLDLGGCPEFRGTSVAAR